MRVDNLQAETTITEGGQRVYSPNNKPSAADIGARPASWTPAWNDVSSKPAQATRWPSWDEITGKPSGVVNQGSYDGRYLLKTATAANSSKLDGIGSDGFLRLINKTGSVNTGNWYRIATGTNRSNAEFVITDPTSAKHGYVRFQAGISYGNQPYINVIGSNGFGDGDGILRYLRIVDTDDNLTYGGKAVEVYVDGSGSITTHMTFDLGTHNGWNLIDPTLSSGTAKERVKIDLNTSNGFISTDHMYSGGGKVYSTTYKPTASDVDAYSKSESDGRFLGKTAKAADADKLDGLDSNSFFKMNGWNTSPGQDANTQPPMMSDFTYSRNAPNTGPLVNLGCDNGYELQVNAAYSGGTNISFRTKNGDKKTWNSWYNFYHTGNKPSSSDVGALAKATRGANNEVYAPLEGKDDYISSPLIIRERGKSATGTGDSKYSPNLCFHWGGRKASSLSMDKDGNLCWGEYSSTGVPSTNRVYHQGFKPSAGDIGAQVANEKLTKLVKSLIDTNGGQDLLIRGKRALVGMAESGTGQGLVLNYNNDFGRVSVKGTVYPDYLGRDGHSTGYMVGSYNNVGDNATKTSPIYTIGSNYKPSDTALNNMYGIGYTHSNASFLSGAKSKMGGGWGMYVASDGDARIFLDASQGRLWTSSNIYEGGTALSSKYLGKTAKAADSDKLDGNDSSVFLGGIAQQTKVITVGGDANKYYPVRFTNTGTNGYAWRKWNIARSYGAKAPSTWNSASHKGGLTLGIEWSGDSAWGGNDKNIRVTEFVESYSKMVGGLALSTNGLIVWLRGGGAEYIITAPQGRFASVTVHLSTYTASNKAKYAPRDYNATTVTKEVTNRNSIRGSGQLYDSGSRVYSDQNKPSPATLGAQAANDKLTRFVSSLVDSSGQDFKIRGKRALVGTSSSAQGLVINYGNDFGKTLVQSDLVVTGEIRAPRLECGYNHNQANSIGCSNWFRSSGKTGWFNGSYGGGIYMEDTTWVRVYGSKKFYANNSSTDAIYTAGGVKANKGFYHGSQRLDDRYQRKITYGTGTPKGGSNGDIYIQYK